MTDELIDDDTNSDQEDEREYSKAVAELERRCKTVGFEVSMQEDTVDRSLYPVVNMPCGREKRPFTFWSLGSIQQFLTVPFEKYVCLSGYEAICSYSEGIIESLIRPLDRMPSSNIWRRIYGEKWNKPESSENNYSIEVASPDQPNTKIIISQASDVLRTLTRMPRGLGSRLSIKVLGSNVSRHYDALNLLTRLANAFLFQLEMAFGISLSLERERISINRRLMRQLGQNVESILFPREVLSIGV